MRFWDDVDLLNGVVLHLADSGHANGTPEHDEIRTVALVDTTS